MAVKWLRSGWGLTAFAAGLVIAVVSCVAYVQHEILVAHWNVRRWISGGDDDDASRLDWLHEHRSFVLPIAASALAGDDPVACARAGKLVRVILEELGDPTDPKSVQLSLVALSELRDVYSSLVPAARKEAREAAYILLRVHLLQWSPHVPTALDSAGAVFANALDDSDPSVKKAALQRLPSLWPAVKVDGSSGPLVRAWLYEAYNASAAMLSHSDAGIRLAAASACASAPFADHDHRLAELLDDEDPAVRRGTVLALGGTERPRLHGRQKSLMPAYLGDPETAAAAERILKVAGIADDRLGLLKLQYSRRVDDRAKAAAAAVELSKRPESNFRPTGFLLDLSHDESADVRLSFIDAAVASPADPALHERLRSMAQDDPNGDVRARGKEALAKLRVAVKP
jgi:hypothetical protein